MGFELTHEPARAGATPAPARLAADPARPIHRILRLQRMVGNQAVMRLMAADGVHVSHPEDGHEAQADSVARRVMALRAEDLHRGVPQHDIRTDRPEGQEDTSLRVDRSAAVHALAAAHAPDAGIGTGLERLESAGQPLEVAERAFFEPRFGVSFGAVRVHTGGEADRLARAVDARAFTFNRHIVFRAGEYQPGSHEGRSLLAHELTHTVQQGAADPAALGIDRAVIRQAPMVQRDDASRGRVQRAVTNLAVAGATAEASAADHFVAPRGAAPVVVTATTSAAGQRVSWTGGTARPSNLERSVTGGTARAVTITADTPADPGAQTIAVHILGGSAAPANTPAPLGFSRQPGNPAGLAPFGLTDVRTNNPVARIRAFVVGNQWVFQVQRIAHRYILGITGGANADIRSATSATNANHCRVVVDLTPPAPGAATGPPRASFWSSPITLAHENAHVAHFYSPPFWEAFMRVAETTVEAVANNVNVDHTNAATLNEATVLTAAAVANQTTIDAQHVAADAAEIGGSEVFAHGQSNPMYTTLVAQIAARFRPIAPTVLVAAAAGPTNVNLTWTHNACNETEYRVYRRRQRGAFTRIATLPAGAVAFADNLAGLAGGTDFTYFVTAAGVAGESNRSNQAAVHTP